jgi:AcrR family transcriptional regulator
MGTMPSLSAADGEPPATSARDRILATAHDLFYRDGIRATGIDRLIAESGVAKLTFYRHFPSKNDLILAFLDHRHQRWMAWFTDALRRHRPRSGSGLKALAPALAEWFASADYRGCAFINTVTELGGVLPAAVDISCRHKDDMTAAIAALMPPSRGRAHAAEVLAMAVDGAIVRAQFDATPAAALKALRTMIGLLQAKADASSGPQGMPLSR